MCDHPRTLRDVQLGVETGFSSALQTKGRPADHTCRITLWECLALDRPGMAVATSLDPSGLVSPGSSNTQWLRDAHSPQSSHSKLWMKSVIGFVEVADPNNCSDFGDQLTLFEKAQRQRQCSMHPAPLYSAMLSCRDLKGYEGPKLKNSQAGVNAIPDAANGQRPEASDSCLAWLDNTALAPLEQAPVRRRRRRRREEEEEEEEEEHIVRDFRKLAKG